jgi:hypothetical protein
VEDYYQTRVFPHLARRFAACHFRGAFGLDALVYRAADGTPTLRAVVELNPRHTMGRVALELRRLAHSSSRLHFSLATLRSAQPTRPCQSLSALAAQLETENPVGLRPQGDTVKIDKGTLILNDPTTAQRFLAVLTVHPGGRSPAGPAA